MQKTKNPPALAVMTRRLMAGGGLSEVELSFTALKSVTPGRRDNAMRNKERDQQPGGKFNRIKHNLVVAPLSPDLYCFTSKYPELQRMIKYFFSLTFNIMFLRILGGIIDNGRFAGALSIFCIQVEFD